MSDCLTPRPFDERSPQQVERVARLIDKLLADERTEPAAARYYDPDSDFVAHTFLDLAPNEPYALGPPDLLAAALIEGNPGPRAARRLLAGGEHAACAAMLLARIPLGRV